MEKAVTQKRAIFFCREAVTSIALSEDGTVLYSVGKEGAVIMTDIATGKRQASYCIMAIAM